SQFSLIPLLVRNFFMASGVVCGFRRPTKSQAFLSAAFTCVHSPSLISDSGNRSRALYDQSLPFLRTCMKTQFTCSV
ncbi:hypothetical protein L9F63_016898, partial [Diploptera punctata]